MALRLNLGCWKKRLPGFVNIDLDPSFAEVVADAAHLPYEDDSVDEIYAGHLLEHFALTEDVLKEWHRVLKPGGVITVTVPDIEKGLEEYRKDQIDLEWFNQIVFGGQDRDKQHHHQVFTEDILITQLRRYFGDVELLEECPYLMGIVAWQTIARAKKV